MKIENSFYSTGKFSQRTRTFYGIENGLPSKNVTAITVDAKGTVWAGTDTGLAFFNGKEFSSVDIGAKAEEITLIFTDKKSKLYVSAGTELFSQNSKKGFEKIFDSAAKIVDYSWKGDILYILTEDRVYKKENNAVELVKELEGKKGISIAVNDEHIYVASPYGLLTLSGKRTHWKAVLSMFSDMPYSPINKIRFDPLGHLWCATNDGLNIYDNYSFWATPDKLDSLPAEKLYDIVFDNSGNRYFASDNGVIILEKGVCKYLGSRRWVPSAEVSGIVLAENGDIWAATDDGIGCISSCMMSLRDKADYYQKTVEQYHVRDIGYVTIATDIADEDISTGRVEISDNDGLWTAKYCACQSYRYAVTGDKQALEFARRSMKALLYLMNITGIKGFPARAIRREGEKNYGDGDHEWPLAADGSCEWKCETSSDEITGHFLGMSIYYDLCADKKEKEEIKVAMCGIVDHILEHDYKLCDYDGLPTTWAEWSPESLNSTDKWIWERGINSLEFLAFLKVAEHMSGDKKYTDEYMKLIKKHHYLLNAAHHKMYDGHTCHIDCSLGFLSSAIIFSLEKNEDVRAILHIGLEHMWQYEKIERTPFWNFIYGANTNNYCDIEAAVQTMREMPLSLMRYKVTNSTRKKLVYDNEQAFWGEPPQLIHPLPMDERHMHKHDSNPFKLDSGDSRTAEDGTVFLLPYWYARYYGLIKESDDNSKK